MTRQQKTVLIISILASFVAFLDGSVVNVALPAITRELGGGLAGQQWVVDAYLITLGALILLAGSLSDLFGRVRILVFGLIGFGVTSLLCAIAPSILFLTIARALQGVAGALLVPSSLALIMSSFPKAASGKAIGQWTAWTGMAMIIGPLVGGLLVDSLSWRLIFAINIVPIVLTLFMMRRLEAAPVKHPTNKVDVVGALLCTIGLGASVYALIEQPHYGWSMGVVTLLGIGIASLVAFVWYESRSKAPMLSLSLFLVRNFSVGNIATAAVYGGLAIGTFLIVVYLQQVAHFSAVAAGLSLLPVTIIMFFLSSRFGMLASRMGPRLFMALGPAVAGVGFLMMLGLGSHVTYWTDLLPGVLVFGLGLSITVAPLTAAILGDIDTAHAGVASAVNNAVARIAGLLTVAALGFIIGPTLGSDGFHKGLLVTALLMFAGAVISGVGIVNHKIHDEMVH